MKTLIFLLFTSVPVVISTDCSIAPAATKQTPQSCAPSKDSCDTDTKKQAESTKNSTAQTPYPYLLNHIQMLKKSFSLFTIYGHSLPPRYDAASKILTFVENHLPAIAATAAHDEFSVFNNFNNVAFLVTLKSSDKVKELGLDVLQLCKKYAHVLEQIDQEKTIATAFKDLKVAEKEDGHLCLGWPLVWESAQA